MKRLGILLVVCLADIGQAEVTPRPGPGDPHVQSVDYDAEQVVALRVAQGFAVTIEFSPDERIENVSVGNSAAWQATPNRRADHLFVKPMQGATATNLTVITDARRYNFSLVPAYGPEPDLPYSVRFTYPAPVSTPDTIVEVEASRYIFRGDKKLRPAAMSDDGQFTSIAWPPDTTMPAVFIIDARGQETLVNGAIRDAAYVVDGVSRRFVFRLGKAEATAVRKIVRRKR